MKIRFAKPLSASRLKLTMVLLVMAVLLAACGSDSTTNERPTVLIGIDGGEWQIIDHMIADGELPNLARIKSEGAWGHLINNGMQVSPVVWTTFVTGHFARQHGVLAHVFPYTEEGAKRPVTSELRQVPALWNIATHYGLRSNVVGYFVSHPPEEINGVMVSSQAPTWIEGAVSPPDALALEELRYQELTYPEVREAIQSPYFGWDYDPAQAEDADSPYQVAAATVLERHLDRRIIRDEFLRRATRDLIQEPVDLFIAYYRITDIISHSLWQYYDPQAFENPPEGLELELFGESVKQAYRFTDEAVGELLDAWNGQANFIIVSDHGFGPAAEQKMNDENARVKYLSGDHRSNGIVMAIGPDIQPGEIEGVSIMEIAPTLAALLGVPVSGEMPGEVATDLLRPDFFADNPLQTVPTYDAVSFRQESTGLDSAVQEEEMNSLRGLGYVGEGVDFDSASLSDGYDYWTSSEFLVSGNIMSEIFYYLMKGDQEAAQATLDLVKEERPDAYKRTLAVTRAKYRSLMERLPEGTLDPGPFNEFFKANHIRQESAAGAEEAP